MENFYDFLRFNYDLYEFINLNYNGLAIPYNTKPTNVKLEFDNIDIWLSVKVILIVIYRFLFVFFMLQFLYFISKSVIYLTDFTLYEFNNLK